LSSPELADRVADSSKLVHELVNVCTHDGGCTASLSLSQGPAVLYLLNLCQSFHRLKSSGSLLGCLQP